MYLLYKIFTPERIKKIVDKACAQQEKQDRKYWENKIEKIKKDHKYEILAERHKYETEIKSLYSELDKWERREKTLKKREYKVRVRAQENLHVSTRIADTIEDAGMAINTVVGSMARIKNDAVSVNNLLTKEQDRK